MQRGFLGQVVSSRVCPTCGGTGQVIPEPCPECAGDGRVRARRTIPVKMPAGVEDGMRIRLTGQGEVGPGGGPAGDLYVEIHERPHPVFTRDGEDLHCRVTLPMTAAALGHDAEPQDPRRRGGPRHQARHPVGQRRSPCARTAPRGCGRPAAATCWCTSR